MKRTVRFLNVDIQSITQEELLRSLSKGTLITPNVDHLVKLQKDKEFYTLYQKAEWIICDSKILYLMSKLLKHSLPMAIPGSTFSPLSMNTIRMILIVKYSYWVPLKVLRKRQ